MTLLLWLAVSSCSILPVVAQFSVEVLQPTSQRGGRHTPVERCEATGATFGSDVASFSFSQRAIACAVYVDPLDACKEVTFDPELNGTTTSCNNFFAIVPRGNCNFSEKAYHVQYASPVPMTAIIIYNVPDKPPVDMNGGKYANEVKIPVLMISYNCMLHIMNKFPANKGYLVQIKISPGYYDLFRYLIPFVVVVGFCFIVLLISLAIRLCRERRRIARKRLSKKNLKKIPTRKYQQGDVQDTCAICLEEFTEGEKLRVLPCRHSYHCACIDPWLTQNRKVCPMCKRRVGAKNSDSESSDEERSQRRLETLSANTPSTSTSTMTFHVDDEVRTPTQEHISNEQNAAPETPTAHSTISSVMVEVHRNQAMGGSREQLVEEDFLSDVDHVSEDEAETSLSQSLKKRLKGLFNRSGNEATLVDQDFGRINSGFQGSSHSVIEDGSRTLESQPAPTDKDSSDDQAPLAQNEHHNDQFADPFEGHPDDPNSTVHGPV